MPKRRTKGGLYLVRRNGVYYIRGTYLKQTVYESTGVREKALAEPLLIKKRRLIEDEATGVNRTAPTFGDLADRHIEESAKKSIETDIIHIKSLIPYIGQLPMNQVYRGKDGKGKPTRLEQYIIDRAKEGKKSQKKDAGKKEFKPLSVRAVNGALDIINIIGNKATQRWRCENGRPLMAHFTPVYKINTQEGKKFGLKPRTQPP